LVTNTVDIDYFKV